MIRRLIQWLYPDLQLLEDAAAELAGAIGKMTPDQQAEAFLNHRDLWWNACGVATVIEMRGRR
ncbi:hypothetical protein [Nonomuraea angiospora]|uniref:hypothetical protein n=1 Tax=Nonomuraea angiospora TaxID=46172 RepID=UPI0029AC80DA|nr:hypothetical protein [Nonomuraea angiospora]MDX3111388.1 hypothetical protein [Nonomuraea angiospora]